MDLPLNSLHFSSCNKPTHKHCLSQFEVPQQITIILVTYKSQTCISYSLEAGHFSKALANSVSGEEWAGSWFLATGQSGGACLLLGHLLGS